MTIAMKNYIPFVLVLALATSVLSTPIPASRRASGIVVKYSDKYPAENEAPTRSGVSETITLSDIEELLSADVPLPSTLLMALPSIKAKAAAPVATPAATTTQTWDPATVELQQMLANVVTRSMCLALAGFAGCFLALVACTIQRWRNGNATGAIFLVVDEPRRRSNPSICADYVDESYMDEKTIKPADSA